MNASQRIQPPAEWDAWEADRVVANKERAQAEREQEVRQRPLVIDALLDRCDALELAAYLQGVALDACLQLLEEQRQQLVFERGLLRAVLAEGAPVLRVVDQKEAA